MNKIRLAGVALALVSAASLAMAQGGDLYKQHCAMCHGADGAAATGAGKSMNVAPFKSPGQMKLTDAQIFEATKNGKGKMRGYAGKLTDSQIKEVVAHVRALQK